jgi:hypothetical protein
MQKPTCGMRMRRGGLGERFEKMVEKELQKIAQNPEFYGGGKAKYREVSTEVFPYRIVYDQQKNEVNLHLCYLSLQAKSKA